MYGAGYGIGKMMEGVSGGMLQGKLRNMALDKEEQDRRFNQDIQERQLALQERRTLNDEHMQQIQKSTNALSAATKAYEATGDKEVFGNVYRAYYPDATEIPDINIQNRVMSIDFQGMKIKGAQDQIKQAIDVINKNPGATIDVLNKLSELGLAEIVIPEQKDAGIKTLSPGQRMVDEKGNVIYTAPESDKESNPTPQQALKRISEIQKSRATLNKEDKVTQMLVAMNPDMKGMLGQEIPDELKKQLNDAFDAEIEYLRQFTVYEIPDMPDATANKDRIIRDTVSGKRYKSDGAKWVEVQ